MAIIQLPLKGGETLVVSSNWDSGRHCNFQAGVIPEHKTYAADSLDKHLSKAQIKVLECMLAAQIKTMLEGE
jgi:hypothetical protein